MFVLLFFIFALIIKSRTLKKEFAAKVKLEVLRLINEEKGEKVEFRDSDLIVKVGRTDNPQSAPTDQI
jgi:hypothetical protein